MKLIKLTIIVLFILLMNSCNRAGKNEAISTSPENLYKFDAQALNRITDQERSENWILLFDGETTHGWKNFNEDSVTGWIVEDGCLVGQGLGGDIGGDIVSEKEYDNFILKWDWKLGPHGNSGVMYHVIENESYAAAYETGPEYQLIDDKDFRDEKEKRYRLKDWQKTGADYAMYVANEQKKVNLRGWNNSIIMFTPEKTEYWLNGIKLVEFVPWSEDWTERRNSGKWDDFPDYGLARTGKLCLQDHGSKVWFRNIKIKEL